MQVVLKQDVKDLGKKGQMVNVSDGYGKNFLIPRKLAVIADATALNELKNRESSEAHRLAVEKATALSVAETINGKTLKISAKAGSNGRLFGSVTSKEISEKLKSDFGVEVDKKKLVIGDIRNYGTYECTAKIYTGIVAKLTVEVGE